MQWRYLNVVRKARANPAGALALNQNQTKKINRERIVDLEMQLIEGIKTSNIELLDSMLHNDLLFLAPNGQTITKAMDLASPRAGEMKVEKTNPHV